MSKVGMAALAAACGVVVASSASATTNILPGAYTSVTVAGTYGVLRSNSGWDNSQMTASNELAPITGPVQPEQTQWNHDSFWWDATVSTVPVSWTVTLDKNYTLTGFSIQADDNDSYLLQYWTGATWATAYAIPTDPGYGLMTRPTYTLASPITTDQLKFTATGDSDGFYALGHIEAYAAPEPSTWALMGLGFAGLAFAGYRASRQRASFMPAARGVRGGAA